MTKEEWKYVEDQAWFGVKLKIDDFDITIRLQPCKMKLYYVIYVNGTIKGSDIGVTESRIAKRFYWKKTKSAYPRKDVTRIQKNLGKRNAAKYFPGLHKKIVFYDPFYSSFRTLRRTLEENNKNIELVKYQENDTEKN